jgi:hypothetical protein
MWWKAAEFIWGWDCPKWSCSAQSIRLRPTSTLPFSLKGGSTIFLRLIRMLIDPLFVMPFVLVRLVDRRFLSQSWLRYVRFFSLDHQRSSSNLQHLAYRHINISHVRLLSTSQYHNCRLNYFRIYSVHNKLKLQNRLKKKLQNSYHHWENILTLFNYKVLNVQKTCK